MAVQLAPAVNYRSNRMNNRIDRIETDKNTKNQEFQTEKIRKKIVRRQKMKCWGSSETRFGKVWSQMEPCLGGKRPFKVCIFLFQFFGVFLAAKRRTGLKLWQQTDLELPDISFHAYLGPAWPKQPKIESIESIESIGRSIDRSNRSLAALYMR